MEPIVIDPATYDVKSAFLDSRRLVFEFCSANSIAMPDVIGDGKKRKKRSPSSSGYCTNRTIFHTSGVKPALNPGYSWSFTGYKSDMTAYGIMAHELGHWFHFRLSDGSPRTFGDIGRSAAAVAAAEPAVTSYEPNGCEVLAEAARLYILNPDLLRAGRPRRFEFLEKLGMKTIIDATWETVLANAGERRLRVLEKWIAAGKRI